MVSMFYEVNRAASRQPLRGTVLAMNKSTSSIMKGDSLEGSREGEPGREPETVATLKLHEYLSVFVYLFTNLHVTCCPP